MAMNYLKSSSKYWYMPPNIDIVCFDGNKSKGITQNSSIGNHTYVINKNGVNWSCYINREILQDGVWFDPEALWE